MIRNRESLIIAGPQSNHITGFSIEEVANLTARNAIRVFPFCFFRLYMVRFRSLAVRYRNSFWLYRIISGTANPI